MEPKKVTRISILIGILVGIALGYWIYIDSDDTTYYADFHPDQLFGFLIVNMIIALPIGVTICYIAGLIFNAKKRNANRKS